MYNAAGRAPASLRKERTMSAMTNAGRGLPVWARWVLLAAAIMALGAISLFGGGAAQAQTRASADLHPKKTVKPQMVRVGNNQTFTIKVTNQRGGTARDVVMTDPLPDKVRFIRASTSRHVPGSCSAKSGTVTCDLGNIKVGKTVTVKILVKNVEAGNYINHVHVSHSTTELEAADNSDTASAKGTERQGGGGHHHHRCHGGGHAHIGKHRVSAHSCGGASATINKR